jgi:hypothetical protein
MERELLTWLESLLDAWRVESDVASQTPSSEYFLGLPTASIRHAEAGVWAGAGHQQYLVAGDHPLLTPDMVKHPSCPGTTLMMIVQSEDPAIADAVWRSKVNLSPTTTITVDEIGLRDKFESPSFALEIPDGWTAAACPDSLIGLASDGSALAFVEASESTMSLEEWSEDAVRAFVGEEPTDIERRVLPNDVPANLMRYAETFEDGEWESALLTAVWAGRAYVLYLSYLSAAEGSAAWEGLTVIRDSFTPVDGAH